MARASVIPQRSAFFESEQSGLAAVPTLIEQCATVPPARLAKLILTVCQTIEDRGSGGAAALGRKRGVFAAVQAGQPIAAIAALAPGLKPPPFDGADDLANPQTVAVARAFLAAALANAAEPRHQPA